MAVTINLTPTALAVADYPTAKAPALGGEKTVYLTTSPSYLLGTIFLTADGTVEYKYVSTPTAGTPGPIVAVAIGGGITQTAADTITYGGLTGSFNPVEWSANTTFNFPVGRGVELTGTYSAPTSSSAPTLSLGGSSGMLRGSRFALYEMPTLASFVEAGCTTDKRTKIPARNTKAIPCGMEGAEWTKPGMTQIGELEVSSLNQGFDDGLLRYAGVKCQVMTANVREGRLVVQRDFYLDWTPEVDTSDPAGDGESTVTLRGQYSRLVVLLARGTP